MEGDELIDWSALVPAGVDLSHSWYLSFERRLPIVEFLKMRLLMFCIGRSHGQVSTDCRLPIHRPDLLPMHILLRVLAEIDTGGPSVSTNSCLEEFLRGSGLSLKEATGDNQTLRTGWGENLESSSRALRTEETVELGFR